eukprot:1628374-Pleurochrysis_carterae.AAC.1
MKQAENRIITGIEATKRRAGTGVRLGMPKYSIPKTTVSASRATIVQLALTFLSSMQHHVCLLETVICSCKFTVGMYGTRSQVVFCCAVLSIPTLLSSCCALSLRRLLFVS